MEKPNHYSGRNSGGDLNSADSFGSGRNLRDLIEGEEFAKKFVDLGMLCSCSIAGFVAAGYGMGHVVETIGNYDSAKAFFEQFLELKQTGVFGTKVGVCIGCVLSLINGVRFYSRDM